MLEAVGDFLADNAELITGGGILILAERAREYRNSYFDTLENPPEDWEDKALEAYSEMADRVKDGSEGRLSQTRIEIIKGILNPKEAGTENALKELGYREGLLEEEYPVVHEVYKEDLHSDNGSHIY